MNTTHTDDNVVSIGLVRTVQDLDERHTNRVALIEQLEEALGLARGGQYTGAIVILTGGPYYLRLAGAAATNPEGASFALQKANISVLGAKFSPKGDES